MKTSLTLLACAILPVALSAQQANGRDAFLKQQAYAEMQRVSGQIDVLQNNFEELQRRVSRLEGGKDSQSLRAEIEALKGTVAELKRELANQRGEIVRDLSGRIAKMQPREEAPKTVKQTVVSGPHFEYTVQSGDTLSLIAKAFKTTVPKIRAMNTFKGDNLRVGQTINVPKE